MAFSSSSFNFKIHFSSTIGLLIFSKKISGISSTSSLAISSGSSIWTAPGLSEVASLKALFKIYGIREALTTVVENFVIDFIIETTSIIWKSHCFDFLIGFCPVITKTGKPQSCA